MIHLECITSECWYTISRNEQTVLLALGVDSLPSSRFARMTPNPCLFLAPASGFWCCAGVGQIFFRSVPPASSVSALYYITPEREPHNVVQPQGL